MLEKVTKDQPDIYLGNMPVVEYCPACDYPAKDAESCLNCEKTAREAREAAKVARAEDIKRLGGLRAYESFTFKSLKIHEGISKAVEILKMVKPDVKGFFIHGPAGTGKTHIATAAVRGFPGARVFRESALVNFIRAAKLDGPRVYDYEMEKLSSGVLVIDDIGEAKDTSFSVSTILEILDSRYMSIAGGLIVTSNLSPDELAQKVKDDRLMSRLSALCIPLQVEGKDYRLKL